MMKPARRRRAIPMTQLLLLNLIASLKVKLAIKWRRVGSNEERERERET